MADSSMSDVSAGDLGQGAMNSTEWNRVRGYDPVTRTYSEPDVPPPPSQERLAVLYKRWSYRK